MACIEKTKLLILVKLANAELFGRDAPLIATAQETREMVILGERFCHLRATLEDDRCNILVREEG